MFGKIREFLGDLCKGERFYHIRYGLKYVAIWLVLCLIITNVYGEPMFDREREYRSNSLTQYIEQQLAVLRETARTQDLTTAENKLLVKYTMQQLDAYSARYALGDVRTGTSYWSSTESRTHTHEDDNAYLVIIGNDGKAADLQPLVLGDTVLYYDANDHSNAIKENVNKYYSCPRRCLQELWDETIGIRKNVDSAWWVIEKRTGWKFTLVDGYLAGTEFRPGRVHAAYFEDGTIVEEKDITFEAPSDKRFEYVKEFSLNELRIPKDVDEWKTESETAQYDARYPIHGNLHVLYPLYFNPRWTIDEYEIPIAVHSYLMTTKFVMFGRTIPVPFSYCAGDFAYTYSEHLTDVKGHESNITLRFTAPGLLKEYNSVVFGHLLTHYFVLGVLIGLLAFRRYRRMFSLRSASRFHKTLINSMAHDLKTPLMIMQGFGENLAENVHSEKREYYAGQILDNIKYLNGLINKNLDLAKNEDVTVTRISMFMMNLVGDAENRYQELLSGKNLTVRKEGDMLVHGDKALLQAVVDNLIVNAIKYSPEGSEILVYVKKQKFNVSNSASLSYAKNINKLLEPLEMGDESRTTGKGTGLGLSIANTIVEQHGWKMKLSYDRMRQIFTCTIKVPKRRQ